MQSLSETRGCCRIEAIRAPLDNLEPAIPTLIEIAVIDNDHGGEANGLVNSIEDFKSIFILLRLKKFSMQ